jgi:putative redox protein
MAPTTAAPPQTMSVRYDGGERYEIAVRDHTIAVDQPVDAGGEDLAPTPTELFVASLASCVAFYAGRYLSRHAISREGLGVTVSFQMADDRPARVTDIKVEVRVPEELPDARRPALQAVVEHCTVHNSLVTPPRIRVLLS